MSHDSRATAFFRSMAAVLVALQVLPPAALASGSSPASSSPPPAVERTQAPQVTPNRTMPHVAKPPEHPAFSSPPLDGEIARVRLFEEPLAPTSAKRDVADDSALAAAIEKQLDSKPGDLASLEQFVRVHPDSRWTGSIMLGLGLAYLGGGRYSRALDSWESAWRALKAETSPRSRALADRTIGELVSLNAHLGRQGRLRELLGEIAGRDISGTASVKAQQARAALSAMESDPAHAFRCGPLAVRRILLSKKGGIAKFGMIEAEPSSEKGTSLLQMAHLSEKVGLDLAPARRSPGAAVVVPSLVHWKVGHFAAIVAESDGRVLIDDPTMNGEFWMTRAALDEEASGAFLVPAGALREGWTRLASADAGEIWGSGTVDEGDPQIQGCPAPSAGGGSDPPCSNCTGMARYSINLVQAAIFVSDSPVGYSPPVGPSAQFTASYNEAEVFQPQLPLYSNLGPKWTFGWFAYAQDDPSNPAHSVDVYLPSGGMETYSGLTSSVNTSAPHYRSRAVVARTSPTSYERRLPDGSVEVYAQPDGTVTYPRRLYLTGFTDPAGNQLHITYSYEPVSGGLRIAAIADAIGQVTTFAYDSTDPLKITRVTDPFGRSATFEYDVAGRLSRIVDVIGLASAFTYGGGLMAGLDTPYGHTTFVSGSAPNRKWIEVTDPLGGSERVEYGGDSTPGIPSLDSPLPVGMSVNTNGWQQYRNTFYWDKRAMAAMPDALDYTKATIHHWLHMPNSSHGSGILESMKRPLERRVWYNYPGQGLPYLEGTAATPTSVGRVLDDGTTQLYKYEYNALGKRIKETDPLGRETVYVYGNNNTPDVNPTTGTGIDPLQVKQKNPSSPGGYDLLVSQTYDTHHRPLTVTDASGQTTTYTYNAEGEVLTAVTPPRAGLTEAQRTTTYGYDADGRLQTLTGPESGAISSFTYDAYGRTRTVTDLDNFTVTYDYDALDRVTKATFPDGTFEETIYSRLDPERRRDRLGRWSHSFYDALRRPVATRDPLGRTITQQWCNCGSLEKVIDANNNAISWERDLQGRVTRELRADGSHKDFVYENTTSRLKQVTDAKSQVIGYQYFNDDNLKVTTYTNAEHPTADVNLTYDANYDRLTTMVDGTGTTTWNYDAVGQPPSLGATRVASVDGPLVNDVVSFGYDELGRMVSRSINGVTQSQSYDSLGRVTSQTNRLGTFTYGYVGITPRVATKLYPNGQSTTYDYQASPADHRLKEIYNTLAGGATLSKLNYTYDALGNIRTWKQQSDSNPATQYELGYDAADQLTSATLSDATPSILKRYGYGYDRGGNRTTEQIDDGAVAATYDGMNRLTSQQPGGALTFRGTVSEPATVAVQGNPSTVSPANAFEGRAQVAPGTSTVAVQATDASGNARTNTYQVTQAGSFRSLAFDANGNLSSDGTRAFEWDAENRLVTIVNGTRRTELTYNGKGERVRIVEKDGGTVLSDKRLLWWGVEVCEERDGVTGAVTKRFFGDGVEDNGTIYFYVRDHLGSVIEMTSAAGAVQARYQYDPWGRRTKVSGSLDADFGYTGHYVHATTGLSLTLHRVYDPGTGRWLSEDPAGDGPNAYTYVANEPTVYGDPSGLIKTKFSWIVGDQWSVGRTELKPLDIKPECKEGNGSVCGGEKKWSLEFTVTAGVVIHPDRHCPAWSLAHESKHARIYWDYLIRSLTPLIAAEAKPYCSEADCKAAAARAMAEAGKIFMSQKWPQFHTPFRYVPCVIDFY